MIDLSDICGLPILMDEISGDIFYDESLGMQEKIDVLISEMCPVLLNKSLKYPEKVYQTHHSLCTADMSLPKGISYDLFQIPNGLLGIEFNKTHVFYSDHQDGKFACLIEVITGELTVMVQKNAEAIDPYSINTRVKEFDMFIVKEGERLAIPSGYFYSFINASSEQTVFTVVSGELHRLDYSKLQREKGLAYFIISKNARIEVVANPRYKCEAAPIYGEFETLNPERREKYTNDLIQVGIPLIEIVRDRIAQLRQTLLLGM